MDEIISYKMCAVKVRNAKLRNYLNVICYDEKCRQMLVHRSMHAATIKVFM